MNIDDPRNKRRDDDEIVRIQEVETTTVHATDDPAEIRLEIEQTRAEMSETIDEIQARLSPDHLREQAREYYEDAKHSLQEQAWGYYEDAKNSVRDATVGKVEHMMHRAGHTISDTRQSITETIKENPIPAALVGIGLGWLYMNRRTVHTHEYDGRPIRIVGAGGYRDRYYYDDDLYGTEVRGRAYRGAGIQPGVSAAYAAPRGYDEGIRGEVYERESARDMAERAKQSASEMTDRARQTASGYMSEAQHRAEDLAHRARYQASRLEHRVEDLVDERPLLIGALVLGIGAAIGLALPRTRKEDQLLGEARDGLLEMAQDAAEGAVDQVKNQAKNIASNIASEAVSSKSNQQSSQSGQQSQGSQGGTTGRQGSMSGGTSGSSEANRRSPNMTGGTSPTNTSAGSEKPNLGGGPGRNRTT